MKRKIGSNYFKKGRVPLTIVPYDCQRDIEFHSHSFSELVIILSGDGIHFTESEEFRIIAGDVFFINTTLAHGYKETDQLSLINILFDWDGLQLPWHDLRDIPGYHGLFTIEPNYRNRHNFLSRLRLNLKQLEKAEQLCSDINTELESDTYGRDIMSVAKFAELVIFLSRCYSSTKGPMSKPILRLGKVFSYIQTNYAQDISLKQLSEMSYMSVSSLRRSFIDSTGHSPIDYLINVRIKRASELLRQTDMDISTIAFEVGFNDSNYFSRQFKKIMSMPPKKYRESIIYTS